MSKTFTKGSLTGGGAGALDEIDADELSDGDRAIVVTTSDLFYVYILDDDSAVAESSPTVIAPDEGGGVAYTGDKRWELVSMIPASITAAVAAFQILTLGGEIGVEINDNGNVELYFNNSKKFETSNTGATLAGTLIADGLTLGDDEYIQLGNAGRLQGGTNTVSILNSGGTESMMTLVEDLGCTLFFNNSVKLTTLVGGVEVTGELSVGGGGCLVIPEVTTPSAEADHGKIYTKTDNKLYFQSGAGTEYEITMT